VRLCALVVVDSIMTFVHKNPGFLKEQSLWPALIVKRADLSHDTLSSLLQGPRELVKWLNIFGTISITESPFLGVR
jgi:hypothetical protein